MGLIINVDFNIDDHPSSLVDHGIDDMGLIVSCPA
jgi:hypothetical protein